MKEVKAIIRPNMLDRVLDALREIEGLPAVVVTTADVLAAEQGNFERVGRTKLEVMVPHQLVETVVRAIQSAAHTGHAGDGGIFVVPIEEMVKIRTGEREAAES
jgi:nitrogen regulatory protein P-II 1